MEKTDVLSSGEAVTVVDTSCVISSAWVMAKEKQNNIPHATKMIPTREKSFIFFDFMKKSEIIFIDIPK